LIDKRTSSRDEVRIARQIPVSTVLLFPTALGVLASQTGRNWQGRRMVAGIRRVEPGSEHVDNRRGVFFTELIDEQRHHPYLS